MGQSKDLLISPSRISRDPISTSVSPVSPLPRTCAPSQLAGPRSKPTPRPRPRQRLSLLEAIQLEEEKEGVRDKREGRLATAVREGQDHLVLRLLQAGEPLDGLDSQGVSPLTLAVEARRPAMVALLLKHGATSEPGLLARAVKTAGYLGGHEIAFSLLPRTPVAHLNQPFEGRTALCWAVLRGDLEMVEAILERRPSLEGLKTVQAKTTSEVSALLVSYNTLVPSLQHLARAVVREVVAVGKMDKLPLPSRLFDFVKS